MTTKEQIIQVASQSFFQNGYQNTTVRSIAKDCGISVGNVTYYFKRKEDMLLGFYTRSMDQIYEVYQEHEELHTGGAADFIAIRFVFLYWMRQSPMMFRLYHDTLLVDVIRDEYDRCNNRLLRETAEKDLKGKTVQDIYMISLASSGSEQELMDYYYERQEELDFQYLISYAFRTLLLQLGYQAEETEQIMKTGMKNGFELYQLSEKVIEDFIG